MSASGATLTATFVGEADSPVPTGAFFRYGTSKSSLTSTANCAAPSSASGSFSVNLTNRNDNTEYYYQAVLSYDGTLSEGDIQSFTTEMSGAVTTRAYLDNYEMPATSVTNYGTGTESFGNTSWHAFGTSNQKQRIVSHTFAHNNTTKHNFSLLYDKDMKCALWVAFAMNADIYPWTVERKDVWSYDPALPTSWQPDLSSAYPEQKRNALYSRGHQVASNDRRTTTEQTKQTTYFTNMTPQFDGFNSGMWSSLESDIQKIGNATTGSDMLYVVTGPIFEDGYTTTEDKNGVVCAVPTKYFKCIMKVTFENGSPKSAIGAAYLLPHQNSGATRENVTINYIEQLTGFDFFANIPTGIQNSAEAETHPTSYFPQRALGTTE